MSHPLSDQRTHSDLIAELYDRHAAGLFAYCFDQLGDKGTAADAVVAVLTSVPVVQPRRALLYALARREIARRDVVYFPPVVDFAVDPPTALIERVIRDIRPHQREVLLLAAVCRLTPDELADVLDVAIDTAGQLIISARNRFTQSLKTALYHARHAEYVPERVAEVYGALEVAPIEDVLARLPWQRPPADLRARLLAILPSLDPAGTTQPKTRLPVKQLWPTTPDWPLPLSDPDQTTSTSLIPVVSPETAPPSLDPLGPGLRDKSPGGPSPAGEDVTRSHRDGKPKHEATTEPIPRLQGSILAAMAEAKAFRPWSRKQQSTATPTTPEDPPASSPDAPAPSDEAGKPDKPDASARAGRLRILGKAGRPGKTRRTHRADRTGTRGTAEQRPPAISLSAPIPGDLIDRPTSPIAPILDGPDVSPTALTAPDDAASPGEKTADAGSNPAAKTAPDEAEEYRATAAHPDVHPAETSGIDEDLAAAASPVADAPTADPASEGVATDDTPTGDAESNDAAPPTAAHDERFRAFLSAAAKYLWFLRFGTTSRHGKFKPLKKGEHHFDWAWELVGLLLAIAIALTVFFSMPLIVTP